MAVKSPRNLPRSERNIMIVKKRSVIGKLHYKKFCATALLVGLLAVPLAVAPAFDAFAQVLPDHELVHVRVDSDNDGFVLFADGTKQWVFTECFQDLKDSGVSLRHAVWDDEVRDMPNTSPKLTCDELRGMFSSAVSAASTGSLTRAAEPAPALASALAPARAAARASAPARAATPTPAPEPAPAPAPEPAPAPAPAPEPAPAPAPAPAPEPAPAPQAASGNAAPIYDTVWELPTYATIGEVNTHFDHLASRGFDGALISVLNHTSGGHNGKNANGSQQSFLDSGRIRYGADHLNFIEDILDSAAARGLKVGVVPAWGNQYLRNQNTGACNQGTLTVDNAWSLGNQLSEKIGQHPALSFWMLGGDYGPGATPCYGQPEDSRIWEKMSQGLADAGSTVQVTYHTASGDSLSENSYQRIKRFAGESWVDFLSPQIGHCKGDNEVTRSYQRLANEYNKPIFSAETRYFEARPTFCGNGGQAQPVTATHIGQDANRARSFGVIGAAYGDINRWNWCTAISWGRSGGCGSAGLNATRNTAGESVFLNAFK